MAIVLQYNSVLVTLLLGPDGLQTTYKQEYNQNRSGSGKIETINQHGIQEMAFDAYFTEAVYNSLIGWWSWARQGKTWIFSLPGATVNSTTLDGAAAAGQKNIPLTSTSNFAADDVCFIRAEDADDEFEIVTIASVDSGVKVVTTSNLIFSYNIGDTFRHNGYWPSVISLDTEFNPSRDGAYYRHTFRFAEAL